MQINPCRICGNAEFRYLFDGKDRLYHLAGSFKLYRCCRCGLILIYPVLSEQDLSGFYPSNYYSYESSGLVTVRRTLKEKILYYLRHPIEALNCILYSKLLGQNRDLPTGPFSRVLDIGCGEGRYLLEKRQTGAQCFGVDISEAALERLRKIDPTISTYCGNVWGAAYPDDYFDLVNLCHVLEHVIDINRLLAEIKRALKQGGLLRIQVPNAASLSFRIFGKYWMPLDVPRHVYVFSAGNLEALFKNAGLQIVSCRTLENSFSVIGSSLYVLNELFRRKIELMRHEHVWNNEFLKLLFFPYALLVNLFRLGDSIEFILKKP